MIVRKMKPSSGRSVSVGDVPDGEMNGVRVCAATSLPILVVFPLVPGPMNASTPASSIMRVASSTMSRW